jgi:peptidyl-prolyl cis-trans isomerase C
MRSPALSTQGTAMPRSPSPFVKLRLTLLATLLAMPLAAHAADAPKQPAPQLAPAGDPVVAKINGTVLHLSDVAAAQRRLPQQMQNVPLDTIYPQLLDQLIGNKLVTEAGKSAKLADDAEVKSRIAKIQEQVVAQIYIDRLIGKAVTDDALRVRYQKTLKEQGNKEEVHARHILVTSEEEAKGIITQLDKGGDFGKLATEKSTDKSGSANGGDLGWFSKDMMVPEFAQAAFNLKKGEYTKAPVKTQFGWHVIKLEDRRQAAPPTFEEAKPQLSEQIARETVDAKVKELRSKAKVEEFNPDGTPMTAPEAKPATKP